MIISTFEVFAVNSAVLKLLLSLYGGMKEFTFSHDISSLFLLSLI